LGAEHGPVGLAMSWTAAYPVVFLITSFRVGKAVGLGIVDLIGAMGRPIISAAGMYAAVILVKPFIFGSVGDVLYLLQLIVVGAVSYTFLLWVIHREGIAEILELFKGKEST